MTRSGGPREASTAPSGVPALPAGAEATHRQPEHIGGDAEGEDTLGPRDVRLSDGRLATLRRTTAFDHVEMARTVAAAGYNMATLDPGTIGIFKTLFSIASIDGEPLARPRGKAQLEALLHGFYDEDVAALMMRYAEINGLAPADDDSFRSGLDGRGGGAGG